MSEVKPKAEPQLGRLLRERERTAEREVRLLEEMRDAVLARLSAARVSRRLVKRIRKLWDAGRGREAAALWVDLARVRARSK